MYPRDRNSVSNVRTSDINPGGSLRNNQNAKNIERNLIFGALVRIKFYMKF